MVDAFSRAIGGSGTEPDVISLSYGGCALDENTAAPAYAAVLNALLAMTALTGVSSFVAAGDSGSTTCGTSVSGTTLSYPAVSPFVTAVGGTRLALGAGNTRVSESCGTTRSTHAGGRRGGLSRKQPRPAYQDASTRRTTAPSPTSARWPTSCPAGPTSSAPSCRRRRNQRRHAHAAAATALVDAAQQKAGRPPIGLADAGSTRRPSRSPRPSTTSPRAATTSQASAAARPPPATTSPAARRTELGRSARLASPARLTSARRRTRNLVVDSFGDAGREAGQCPTAAAARQARRRGEAYRGPATSDRRR